MKTIFEKPFVKINWNEKESLLFVLWTPKTERMLGQELQEVLLNMAHFVEDKQIKRWMAQTKDFRFVIVPDLQTWIAGEFNQRLAKAGLQKMAVITSTEFTTNVSIEQTTNEMEMEQEEKKFGIAYFDNVNDGMTWLLT